MAGIVDKYKKRVQSGVTYVQTPTPGTASGQGSAGGFGQSSPR